MSTVGPGIIPWNSIESHPARFSQSCRSAHCHSIQMISALIVSFRAKWKSKDKEDWNTLKSRSFVMLAFQRSTRDDSLRLLGASVKPLGVWGRQATRALPGQGSASLECCDPGHLCCDLHLFQPCPAHCTYCSRWEHGIMSSCLNAPVLPSPLLIHWKQVWVGTCSPRLSLSACIPARIVVYLFHFFF